MKQYTRIAIAAVSAAIAIATLAGCTAAGSSAKVEPQHKAVATQVATPAAAPAKTQAPKPVATPAKPIDPKQLALTASGMSAAKYAQVTAQVAALPRMEETAYDAKLATIAQGIGPNVVLAYVTQMSCPGDTSGKKYWEVAGPLSTHHICGDEDWEQSEVAAIAHTQEKTVGDINYEGKKVVFLIG
ncbi:hypothetical protein GCM10022286_00690 [Gryllotalpicola daejeonensis]|uniref:Lipoprotein n=1 Tax=Gryllotalpicola daejeonensis TaxID=993087 RepID=A0ABP7ZD16_9MICO